MSAEPVDEFTAKRIERRRAEFEQLRGLVEQNIPGAIEGVTKIAEWLEGASGAKARQSREAWARAAMVARCLATAFESVEGAAERVALYRRLRLAIASGYDRATGFGFDFDQVDEEIGDEGKCSIDFDHDKTFYETFKLPIPDKLAWTEPPKAMPLAMIELTESEWLAPIEPVPYLIDGLIPCHAYSLCAGALSAGKTTATMSLGIWRATGHDLLGLEDGMFMRVRPGPVTFITYEDSRDTILRRLRLIVQHAHRELAQDDPHRAAEFVALLARHFRVIHLTGQPGAPLVVRSERGQPIVNVQQLEALVARLKAHAASDHLVMIDPLRLAFRGSQNDDDGADLIVMVLNDLATRLRDSAVLVASHTTKALAAEPGTNRIGLAYGTAGSGLYSQHARSNFHMGRMTPDAIRELNLPDGTLSPQEIEHQSVTVLTHARLSQEAESRDARFIMRRGVLVPLIEEARPVESVMTRLRRQWPVVAAAIRRVQAEDGRVSQTMLVNDPEVNRGQARDDVRSMVKAMIDQRWIEERGATRDRQLFVSAAGEALLDRANAARNDDDAA